MNDHTDLTAEINQAIQIMQRGGVVAFPTDTFYGLGCDPFNAAAVEKLFVIKQRPATKAILLLISSLTALKQVVREFSDHLLATRFKLLQEQYWPGPLTIVLPALASLPVNLVSANYTIGVRYPNYALAQRLAAALGGVITATSANLAGQPNTATAAEVAAQLKGVDYILDGGKSPGGMASTLINLTTLPPTLLREGAIKRKELQALLGPLA
jgi:L-threonylcarbamoyladenylate synthase